MRITKPFQFSIAKKLLLFALTIVVVGGAVMVPIIAVVPGLTGFVLFIYSVLLVSFIHAYAYGLYRELLP